MAAISPFAVCARPEGLVSPVRVDPAGVTGPTWRAATGRGWRRTGPGLFVPDGAAVCVEQRIVEQAARLRPDGTSGCVSGWAALRWRGAAYFDGLAEGGGAELPVPLVLGGRANLRPSSGSAVHRWQLAPSERELVAGIPVATVQRALFDEVRRRGELWQAVSAIDMAAAAGLISAWLFARYVAEQNSRDGAPLARQAVSLAIDESWSPREVWLRLVWMLVARLPQPHMNRSVYDLDGRLVGTPDLLDPEAGLVVQYHGDHHRSVEQQRIDAAQEERYRDHGLECLVVVRGESRETVADRMLASRSRAKFLPPESCAWTLERPSWDPEPETLDARLARLGLVDQLTHR